VKFDEFYTLGKLDYMRRVLLIVIPNNCYFDTLLLHKSYINTIYKYFLFFT
jgi:hypothetical protein